MARARRTAPAVGGTVVLDSEGLAAAARNDRLVAGVLASARDRRARVVVCAITLTEVLRGGSRDAGVHRVLSRIPVVDVDRELGRSSGELLGRVSLRGATVDAAVAATALAAEGPVLVLTSDPGDLTTLTSERTDVRVVPV
ncbi:MAG: PIN domain-containing protein [Kineosporiaceae bacterium]